MYAFIALLWNTQNPEADSYASDLQQSIRASKTSNAPATEIPGCCIYDLSSGSSRSRTIPIGLSDSEAKGAVFGTIFRRSEDLEPSPPITSLDARDSREIFRSGGRSLFSKYWGSYIAFLTEGDDAIVLVDPTSAIPCFFLQHHGVTVLFSHLERCPFLEIDALTINLDFISSLVAYDKVQNGRTGFNEISEVPGGSRLRLTDRSAELETIWDPREYARDVFRAEASEIEGELRRTVKYVVSSWGSAFNHITVQLSGGLDSSIVLTCLAETQAQVRAVHHIAESEDPTELHFARAAAQHMGRKLDEVVFRPNSALPALQDHPLTVRPYRHFIAPDMSFLSSLSSCPEGAIFTGQGGDHLFYVSKTPLGFVDYLLTNARIPAVLNELMSAARLSNKSIWSVIKDGASAQFGRREDCGMLRSIKQSRTPVSGRAHDRLRGDLLLPRWATDANGLPPAKFDQVSKLVHMFTIKEVLDRPVVRDLVHPLISQPLIELCLRIPIYRLCENGISRGLARRAFDGLLPEQVVDRMTKAETTRYLVQRVSINRESIASALEAGELVASGIVSSADCRRYLSKDGFQTGKFGQRMLIYYAIEAWLQSWKQARSVAVQ